MLKVNWIITDQNVTVNFDGQTHILTREDEYADKLILAIKEKRYDDVPALVSAAKRIEECSDGLFTVKDGQIIVDGVVVAPCLGRKIQDFAKEGLPFEPLVLFAKNLNMNPSYRATQELYQFLEKNNHPITEHGFFVAYKKVRDDFKDVHSGTFDNSPGNIVEMPRNQVNEDPNQTCSFGLHASNFSYAQQFYAGGKMLEVEINPADVVAVPSDYNQSKLRTCRYKVIGVVDAELSTPLRVVNPPAHEPSDQAETDQFDDEDKDYCENCFRTLDGCYDKYSDFLCDDCYLDKEDEENAEDEEEECSGDCSSCNCGQDTE